MSVVPSREPKAVAVRRMYHACNYAVILGVLKLLLGVSVLISPGSHQDPFLIGVSLVVDALICFGLAYGLYRKSRTVAILFVVYVLAAQVDAFFTMPPGGGTIITLVVSGIGLVLGIRAVLAAFRYHVLMRVPTDSQPDAA